MVFLYRHLKSKHVQKHEEYKKNKVHSSDQPSLESFCNLPGSSKYGPNHPENVRLTRLLVENLIVKCGLPLSIVENEYFREFLTAMNPKFSIPYRKHITSAVLPDLKDKTRSKLQNELAKVKHVAVTLDIWTDRRMHSFLGMTAHTFKNSTASSSLLTFKAFKGSHTGQRIAEEIQRALDENGLRDKVSYVITDNASNMKKALEVMKTVPLPQEVMEHESLDPDIDDETVWEDIDPSDALEIDGVVDQKEVVRLSCFAHSLQLVVKDGLDKSRAAGPVIAKCTKLSSLVHQSALFRELFEKKFGVGGYHNPSVP